MFKVKKHKGFTLIEILVAFAIIGILSAIILVILSVSGKDRANQKSAYSSARSAQARMLQCVNVDNGNAICPIVNVRPTWCRGVFGNSSAPTDTPSPYNYICGIPTGVVPNEVAVILPETWPNLTAYNYMYGQAACSSKSMGAFNFAIYKTGANTGDNIFCCTQNGCSEIEIRDTYNMSSYPSPCNTANTPLNKTLCQCKNSAGLKEITDCR